MCGFDFVRHNWLKAEAYLQLLMLDINTLLVNTWYLLHEFTARYTELCSDDQGRVPGMGGTIGMFIYAK